MGGIAKLQALNKSINQFTSLGDHFGNQVLTVAKENQARNPLAGVGVCDDLSSQHSIQS